MAYTDFVDYRLVEAFRSGDMKQQRLATMHLPKDRKIIVNPSGSWYHADHPQVSYRQVTEGPGHKTWIAAWMYLKTGQPYHHVAIWDTGMAAINDLVSTGHQPTIITDDLNGHSYGPFNDPVVRESIAQGFARLCHEHRMAITGGETASLPFLMNPTPPALDALNMSATATGIMDPATAEIGENVEPGDCILGASSLGPQINGYSDLIDYGQRLPEQFLTMVPGTNQTFGELAMAPTVSVAPLVEGLLKGGVTMKGLLPGTGDGVRKLFRMGLFKYVIKFWPPLLPIFAYMQQLGMTALQRLTVFNNGIGYYIFVPRQHVNYALALGASLGFTLYELGYVADDGEPMVDHRPEKIQIPPRA